MMYETTLVQSRPISIRKVRRKRDSKVAGYHHTARSPRSPKILTPGSSPRTESSRAPTQNTFQGPSPDLHFLDFFDLSAASYDNIDQAPSINTHNNNVIHQHFDTLLASPLQFTVAPDALSSPSFHGSNLSSPQHCSPLLRDSLDMSWTHLPSFSSPENSSGRVSQAENFQSMSNVPFSRPENFPVDAGHFDQSFQNEEQTFEFSPSEDAFFSASFGPNVPSSASQSSTSVQPGFMFETDSIIGANHSHSHYGDAYMAHRNWASPGYQDLLHPGTTSSMSPTYATSSTQMGDVYDYQNYIGSRNAPTSGQHQTNLHMSHDDYPTTGHLETPSPFLDLENDGWIVASAPSSSYALSHHSPLSHGSPTSHASPGTGGSQLHPHMYEVDPRSKPKGRQRSLTAKEKKDARDVRDAKACWACHISKTKCSPCSPGNPCAQCARLVGKRRFCKFDCFNDPLESLFPFMVPDYSMARFQEGNVATLLSGVGWSNHKLRIRLSWGYRRTLEADVVAIALRHSQSDPLAFQHQVLPNGQDKPILTRKQSPPLGVPNDVAEAMESVYLNYVRDIVDNDLYTYTSDGAYNDDDSPFLNKLLWAICSFYLRCARSGEECSLLRQAVEMHITSTILQRSLVLDMKSAEIVHKYLGQRYPERSVPKCAARQIKLTFFTLQRQRIVSILKEWGSLMWTIHNAANNAEKWAVGFSVFIMLTLVIDKTLGAAYSLCESRIEHQNSEAVAERAEFRKLVRLTETELFGRCKEIFHWKFKTRKAGKEACNPVRDGLEAFKNRAVSDGIAQLVEDLRNLTGDFEREIRNHKTLQHPAADDVPYTDCGRLACIFLDDFLERS